MEKKYKLTEETINVNGKTLYRIEALKDFGNVKKGDKGGYVEKEENLSQNGDCWVYDNAVVYGNAEVYDDAKVFEDARIYGNAKVFGNTEVFDNAKVCGNAEVYGNANISYYAKVYGNAVIKGDAIVHDAVDYIVFKNFWSSGRYFTWTSSNNKWSVGCFYGTSEELIKKAYADSEKSGREYERVVRYVESILADEKKEKSN